MKLDIVIVGLAITSSWGNGHATTYRALAKALYDRGHSVTFLEREAPWYQENRDFPAPPYCRTINYSTLKDIPSRFGQLIADADLVIVGSYVPDGAIIGEWVTSHARGVTAFYDIDTPVTLSGLQKGKIDYIVPSLIPRFDLYLSFTGGPALDLIQNRYGSPRVRAFYCAIDPSMHRPIEATTKWDLGYIGTYSDDRQVTLDKLLMEPARRMQNWNFVVAGSKYPREISWPDNVGRIEHLAPGSHAEFYCSQNYTLNITRSNMIEMGYSPSVRLFEAAACGVPIISDNWPGIDEFFMPGEEILIADKPETVIDILRNISEESRHGIAARARKRVMQNHTAQHRARELETYYHQVIDRGYVDQTEAVA
ncbi:MAG TPA: glycosyltransferase [Xanthobacteraceae bacterium]|jgi:spore maturation protein CgeB|nr:glycosyltransferase [Xanthobacteraceae bacterium]